MKLYDTRSIFEIAAIFIVLFLFVCLVKEFNVDEFETLYTAWLIREGNFPYRDFFQIHTPLSYYFFAPLFFLFKDLSVLIAARAVVFLLLIINCFILYQIAQRIFNRTVALASLFFYATNWTSLNKMTEIRPDVLVVLCLNFSLLLLLNKKKSSLYFFLAGIFAGLSFLAKQSGIIFIISVLIIWVFFGLKNKNASECYFVQNFNKRAAIFFISGILFSLFIFLLFLFFNKAVWFFLDNCFNNDFFHKALPHVFSRCERITPFFYLQKIFYFSLALYYFSILGICFMWEKKESCEYYSFLLIFIFLLLSFMALFFILRVWEQEFVIPTNFLSLLAGYTFIKVVRNIRAQGLSRQRRSFFVFLLSIGIVAGLISFAICVKDIFLCFQYANIRLKTYKAISQSIFSLTNKKDKVVSTDAPILFRPSIYYFKIGRKEFYCQTPFGYKAERKIISDLMLREIKIVVPYFLGRFPRQLEKVLRKHYIPSRYFYIPGNKIKLRGRQPKKFDVLVSGWYIINNPAVSLRIDNNKVTSGKVYLKHGRHEVFWDSEGEHVFDYQYDFVLNKKPL